MSQVLATTAYPTRGNGVTYGWVATSLVQARDRNAQEDPRLAGMNFATNGSPATFYVDLPSAGTYNLSLAMGDAGYQQCCGAVPDPVPGRQHGAGDGHQGLTQPELFLRCKGEQLVGGGVADEQLEPAGDASGHAADGGGGNESQHGDFTPIAFLGVAQASGSGAELR